MLISEGKKTNTHAGIISEFEETFGSKIDLSVSFSEFIYQIKNNEPTQQFAEKYLNEAQLFYKKGNDYRTKTVSYEN